MLQLHAVTELGDLRSYESRNKMGVIFSASEAEDSEAAVKTVLEALSWKDWWTCIAISLALKRKSEINKIKQIFVACAQSQLLVAKRPSSMQANLLLTRFWETK